MPKFHYEKHGKSWGVESKVDESTYNAARDMYAETFGLAPAMLEYLIQYAVNQTTQDAMAQPSAAAKQSGDDVAAAAIAAANKRWDKIASGTVSVRSGVGRVTDPFESACRHIMLAKLAAFIKTPKGAKVKATLKGASKETRNLVYTKFMDANRAAIESEAKKQLKANESIADIDLGDLAV